MGVQIFEDVILCTIWAGRGGRAEDSASVQFRWGGGVWLWRCVLYPEQVTVEADQSTLYITHFIAAFIV